MALGIERVHESVCLPWQVYCLGANFSIEILCWKPNSLEQTRYSLTCMNLYNAETILIIIDITPLYLPSSCASLIEIFVSIERWPPLSFKSFQIYLASSNYVITNCKHQVVNVALTQSPSPKFITNIYMQEIWNWWKINANFKPCIILNSYLHDIEWCCNLSMVQCSITNHACMKICVNNVKLHIFSP
jgi:hypothetical protein